MGDPPFYKSKLLFYEALKTEPGEVMRSNPSPFANNRGFHDGASSPLYDSYLS